MNICNYNKQILYKGLEMCQKTEKEFIGNLINQISLNKWNVSEVLGKLSNNGELVKIQQGIYNYQDYYVFNGLKSYYEKNINGYRIAEKTNVKCAPKIIDIIDLPHNNILTVLKLNSSDGRLYSFDKKLNDLSIIERVEILNDFKKMINSNYVNMDAVNSTDNWRITSENRLMLLNWENLYKVCDEKDKLNILSKIKKMIRINDNIKPNVYTIY